MWECLGKCKGISSGEKIFNSRAPYILGGIVTVGHYSGSYKDCLRNKSHKERRKQLGRSKNIKQMQLGECFKYSKGCLPAEWIKVPLDAEPTGWSYRMAINFIHDTL